MRGKFGSYAYYCTDHALIECPVQIPFTYEVSYEHTRNTQGTTSYTGYMYHCRRGERIELLFMN